MIAISEVEESVSESVNKVKENAEGVSGTAVRGSVATEIEELKSQMKEMRDRQHKLLEKNRELRESIEEGEDADPDDESVQKALERQKQLRDDFMELKDELNSLELKTEQIPNDYEFEDIVENFREKTEQLEELMPVVENAFETAQKAREETVDEERLEEQSQHLRSDLVSEEQYSEMSGALGELKDSVNELNDNIAKTRLDEAIDVASIKSQLQQLRDEAEELDAEELEERLREIEISQDIIESELENEILESQEQLETSIYSLASAKADQEDLSALGEEIGKTKVRAGRKINDLESEITALEMRIKELSLDEKVDTSELEDEIERARDEISITLLETLRGFEEETASASEMRQTRSSVEELEHRADELSDSIAQINERLDQVEMEEVVEKSELESRIEDLRKGTASTNELRGVHESLDMLSDRLEKTRSELDRLEVEEKVDRAELEEEVQGAKDEVTISVMESVEKMRREMASKNELRGVHETLSLFNDRHESMKEMLESTDSKLEELEQETDSRFGSLRKDMEERTEELGSMVDEVDERLEKEEIEEKVDRAELEAAMEDLRDEMSGVDAEDVAELERRMEDMSSLMLEMVRKFSAK